MTDDQHGATTRRSVLKLGAAAAAGAAAAPLLGAAAHSDAPAQGAAEPECLADLVGGGR